MNNLHCFTGRLSPKRKRKGIFDSKAAKHKWDALEKYVCMNNQKKWLVLYYMPYVHDKKY